MIKKLEKKRKKAEEERRPFPGLESFKLESECIGLEAVKKLGEAAVGGDEKAIEELIKALKNKDASIREAAAEALRKVIPKLIELLGDEEGFADLTAVRMLGEIAAEGHKEAIRALINALKSENAHVRLRAAGALRYAAAKGQNISEAIPELIELLRDKNDYVRLRVILALKHAAENGYDISEAIEVLREIARVDRYKSAREEARRALKAAGIQE